MFLCCFASVVSNCFGVFFFFKQKTAYEMRISDWSSDVCSSDLWGPGYVSDDYDYDPESVDGRLGEPMALNFVGRSRLSEGRMLLYRAHRDIHSHRPPERLSISLNIMDEGEHVPWRDQIGRASWRERVCQYVWISVVAV